MESSDKESIYHIGACEDSDGREEITIIPTNWISSSGQCYWPTRPPKKNTSKLIARRIDRNEFPDYGWISCKYRPLYTNIYSYQDALRYEKKAMDTSDLGTPESAKRKKQKPNRLVSSSSDEDNSPYPKIPSPLKGSKLQGLVRQALFPGENFPSTSAQEDLLSGINQLPPVRGVERIPDRVGTNKVSPIKISKLNSKEKSPKMSPVKGSKINSNEMKSDMSPARGSKRTPKELTPLKPIKKTKIFKNKKKQKQEDNLTSSSQQSNPREPSPIEVTHSEQLSQHTPNTVKEMPRHTPNTEKEMPRHTPNTEKEMPRHTPNTEREMLHHTPNPEIETHQRKESHPNNETHTPNIETETHRQKESHPNNGTPGDHENLVQQNSDKNFKEQWQELTKSEQLFYIANSLRVMNRNMKVVMKTTASHSSVLEKLWKKSYPSTESLIDLVKELNFSFPMLHEKEFKDLNKKLSPELEEKVNPDFDEDFREKLMNVLRMHNGTLLVDSVNKICGFLLQDELARHYSYEGHKGKRVFKTYAISDIILDTLHAFHPDNDRPECLKKMKWWLGHASERIRIKNEKRENLEALN